MTTDGRILEDVNAPHHDFTEQKGAKDQLLKPGRGDLGQLKYPGPNWVRRRLVVPVVETAGIGNSRPFNYCMGRQSTESLLDLLLQGF